MGFYKSFIFEYRHCTTNEHFCYELLSKCEQILDGKHFEKLIVYVVRRIRNFFRQHVPVNGLNTRIDKQLPSQRKLLFD